MRFTRIYLLLVCSALIPACAIPIPIPGDAPWSNLHANAYASGFAPTLKASSTNIKIPGSSGPELSGSFSLDSEKVYTSQYGARVGFASYELSVSQFSYSRDQTGVFKSDDPLAEFGDGVAGNFPINSTLDIDTTKMMLGIDILNTSVARVGVLLGFDLLSFNKFSLTEVSTGTIQNVLKEGQTVPVPIIGLRADVAIPGTDIRLGAEMTGISIDIDGIEASFFDHDVNLNMEIFENAEAIVGYRMVDISIGGDIEGTAINMDLSMSGPYLGVSVYF
ncbi:MAG: hypothetical protein OSB63_04950 [Planctomycetota bacterium]|nr:hypothetical protein [Planctomycetota bacterium]